MSDGGERGAVLPLFALLLVVLIGAAGLAIDLGWLYFKSIEIQHGADIAALAGVVYEPDRPAEAHSEALEAASENGFVDGSLGGPDTVLIEDIGDNPSAVHHGSQLRATVTQTVPTFFMRIFGISDIDITRTALAEYILPLAMGSPDNTFGKDPSTGFDPGFWASVHGTYGPQAWGDRYAALCLGTAGFGDSGCAKTPEGRPSVSPDSDLATGGYLYGIEVLGGSGLDVQILDGPFYHDGDYPPGELGINYWAGDYGDPGEAEVMATTWFMLYGPDPTPADTTDGNELICSVEYTARTSRAEDYPGWDPTWEQFEDVQAADPALMASMWDSMQSQCGSLDRGPGIYPLRVMVEHDNAWYTTNKYSLRATTTSGPEPDVYGLGDMSIYANFGKPDFPLAKVEDKYAGKVLVVELWDPGDVGLGGEGGGAADTMTISSGNGTALSCTWTASNNDTGSSCSVPVSGGTYNNQLVTITIPIPTDYTCAGSGCWFEVLYTYTDPGVHDTTTWTAFIAGNPIRLVE